MSGRTGGAACSTWSTSKRTNQLSLLDAPSTRSSTPTAPVPPPGRDTPHRRSLGLTRNSQPRSFWGLPGTRANEVGITPKGGSDFECPLCVAINIEGAPADNQLSAYLYAAPQHLVITSTLRCRFVGRLWPYRSGAMHDPANEFPRIPLPRTRVNKGRVMLRVRNRSSATTVA